MRIFSLVPKTYGVVCACQGWRSGDRWTPEPWEFARLANSRPVRDLVSEKQAGGCLRNNIQGYPLPSGLCTHMYTSSSFYVMVFTVTAVRLCECLCPICPWVYCWDVEDNKGNPQRGHSHLLATGNCSSVEWLDNFSIGKDVNHLPITSFPPEETERLASGTPLTNMHDLIAQTFGFYTPLHSLSFPDSLFLICLFIHLSRKLL